LSEAAITFSVKSCPDCGGFWVSEEQLREIEMDEQAALIEFRDIPDPAAQQTPLICPECQRTMDKVRSERDTKVVVDVCHSCRRVWLDDGEIRAIKTDSLVASVTNLFRWMKLRREGSRAAP
jgi:Zn-finger nucleic acid-binding protein